MPTTGFTAEDQMAGLGTWRCALDNRDGGGDARVRSRRCSRRRRLNMSVEREGFNVKGTRIGSLGGSLV